ncbi:MAG: hypothetical protein ACTJGT_00280 [Microbacteriaceae bacterium]
MASSQKNAESNGQEQLFAEVQGGGASFVMLVQLLFALVLVFGGFYVFSLAFSHPEQAIELFVGGLVAVTIGFITAFTSRTK